jgi:hypothetical protein
MLLQPLLVDNLLSPRVETHASVFHLSCLRVLLLELLNGLIAAPYLRVVDSINTSFLDELAFRVISVFLFHSKQVLLILNLVVLRVNGVWRVRSLDLELTVRALAVCVNQWLFTTGNIFVVVIVILVRSWVNTGHTDSTLQAGCCRTLVLLS